MDQLQKQIAVQLREAMERRLVRALKVNQTNSGDFIESIGELSLIELLHGVFLLEGQS